MTRLLSGVLLFCLVVTLGCNRQQSATTPAKDNPGGPVPGTKPPFGNPVTRAQPGTNNPPVVQQPGVPIQPVAQELRVELGDSEQLPVLFFELRPGMVIRVSDIKYHDGGWIDSYEVSVQPVQGKVAKVLVRTETPAGGGKAPTHTATVNGKSVPKQSDKKLIGFSLKDPGGVVLPRSAGAVQSNMQTQLAYDPMGRQQVAQQDFQHEGKTYAIAYSDYQRDPSGRLTGYSAQVVKAQ